MDSTRFLCFLFLLSSLSIFLLFFSISFYGRPASGPNTGWGHMAEWDQVPPIKKLPITSGGRDKESVTMEDTQLLPTCCCPRRTTLYLSHSGQHTVPGVNVLLPHALSQTPTPRTDTHAYNTKLYFPPRQTMFKVVKVIGCPCLDWITKFWR